MTDVAEPIYPLDKAEFVRALATGHGRALIHVERCGAEGVRDEILDAMLFPKVYDAQCNGHGEAWLARLCEAAGLGESFVSQDHGIAGDLELRCGLLAQFALRGNATARAELRELCRYDEKKKWLPAAGEIVEVDGEEGFLFAADRAGEALLKHPDYWGSIYLGSPLDEKAGEGRAMAIMDRESPRNPNIAAFREAVLKHEARIKAESQRAPMPTVDEVIGQILASTKRVPRLRNFGEKATLEERRKVAALDFSKMEPVPLANYLCYFQRSGFPEFREKYLSMLQHPEDRVRWQAQVALSHHAEPQVRRAAYEALARGELASFVRLLRSSGSAEDLEPMLAAISAPGSLTDADEAHDVVLALYDLVNDNAEMNLRVMVQIYESSPCRSCRYDAVELMAGHSILPQWIAEECLSDADDDTRKIAAKYLGVERKF
jgi:hypothetical protein